MKNRNLSTFAAAHAEVQRDLEELFLASAASSVERYRGAMSELGGRLACYIADTYPVLFAEADRDFYVACTAEDADFLCRGIIDELTPKVADGSSLKLACFWNERVKEAEYSVAPILKQYLEPVSHSKVTVIIVKSVISGACVVKTNLMQMIDSVMPDTILVAAPVMHKDSQKRLKSEFPESISSKFEFLYFAEDNEKSAAGEVLPGVGGNVYDLLGLGGAKGKNKYLPDVVKKRRQLLVEQSECHI